MPGNIIGSVPYLISVIRLGSLYRRGWRESMSLKFTLYRAISSTDNKIYRNSWESGFTVKQKIKKEHSSFRVFPEAI